MEPHVQGKLKSAWVHVSPILSLSRDGVLTVGERLMEYTHPGAKIATVNTASQAWVEVRDSI